MADALTVDIVDSKGKKTGSTELPAEIFDVETNIPLMHQVVVAQLARAPTPPRPAAPSVVVAASPTARRAPAAPVRVRPALRSSSAVAPCTARSRVTTASGPPRR